MNKKKAMLSLLLATVFVMSGVINVTAGDDGGNIYKNGSIIGKWNSEMTEQYALAETYEMNHTTKYTRFAYLNAQVKSVYSNTGVYSYYVNKQLNPGEAGSYNAEARAQYRFPSTEKGYRAYTKHNITIDATAYTPSYNTAAGNLITP